ncbi:MAG TPA: hypothetical protein VI434_15815 [Candidatus Dormibacteraeota bacterium]
MSLLKAGFGGAMVALIATACGANSPANTPPATAPPATASPTASAPSGPPSAQVTIAGDASIAGAMTIDTIECSFPSIAGEEIFVTGRPATSAATSIHLTMTAGALAVIADTGSGTGFHARTFAGTGVTGFDAATGAQLSGPLTETTTSSDKGTGVGKITSITGTIRCAGQTTGSSTMVMSGTVAQGALSGGVTDVHVLCLVNEAETLGLVQVGSASEYAVIFSLAGRFTVDLVPPTGSAAFFASTASATSAPTSTGTTVSGDATEQVMAGATAHTIHITGQSTCGSAIAP